jgi:hypothetical protein
MFKVGDRLKGGETITSISQCDYNGPFKHICVSGNCPGVIGTIGNLGYCRATEVRGKLRWLIEKENSRFQHHKERLCLKSEIPLR